MSKKMKLKLDELEVRSFATSLNNNEKDELKGGFWNTGDTCHNSCLPQWTLHFGPCSVRICI